MGQETHTQTNRAQRHWQDLCDVFHVLALYDELSTNNIHQLLSFLQAIEGAIGGNAYQHNKVNQWTSNVVEQCLNQLTKLGKPFKYIGKIFFSLKVKTIFDWLI